MKGKEDIALNETSLFFLQGGFPSLSRYPRLYEGPYGLRWGMFTCHARSVEDIRQQVKKEKTENVQ